MPKKDQAMKFVSTRNACVEIPVDQALLKGLSDDGGLIVPRTTEIPQIEIENLLGKNYQALAYEIIAPYFSGLGEGLRDAIDQAYAGFDEKLSLVQCEDKYILELFNGKTGAFKDMALSLLPYLMQLAKTPEEKILMLTATSGDTGKAALAAFQDVEDIQVIVFYPDQGVSHAQKLQMQTQPGKNLKAVAIHGNFDHAQKAVKEAFSNGEIKAMAKARHVIVSSCNSINIGRLVPQIAYYFYAYVKLVEQKQIELGETINFAVPSGNFGNILAGYFAKKMGLPVGKLIVGSNENNVLTEFIRTGVYDAQREFYKTIAPSMDILVSSNVERLLYLLLGADETKTAMDSLQRTGKYTVEPALLEDFVADYSTEAQIKDTIRQVYEAFGYLIDPHTACGYRSAQTCETEGKTVVLATASIYKFSVAVEEAISGKRMEETDALHALEQISGQQIIESLRDLDKRPILHSEVIAREEIANKIMEVLEEIACE